MATRWVEMGRVPIPALKRFLKSHPPGKTGTLPVVDIMGNRQEFSVQVTVGHVNVSFLMPPEVNKGRKVRILVVCRKEDGTPLHIPLSVFPVLVSTQPEIIEEYAGRSWRGTDLLFERDDSEDSA